VDEGITMAAIRLGNEEFHVLDRGTGRPVVLIHGFPLDHTMWRGQLDALSREGRLLAPDLRGFGRSVVTAGTVTMEQMADDLAAILSAAGVTEPVVFCGLSMGGYVAWQFWRRHRDRLAALILCDTRAAADTAEAAAGRLKTAEKVEREGAQVVADAMLPKLFAARAATEQPQVVEATRQTMLATPPAGIAAALRGMAQRPDMTAELPRIDVPALVVVGAEDVISPLQEMHTMADAMPRARFVEVPGAGHMAPLEAPQAVNAAMSDFLRAL
jgi:3-oxoadipate enol-lactonase